MTRRTRAGKMPIIAAPIFFALHMGTAALLARPFDRKYQAPLMAFGALQGVIEHYADALPALAAFGPPLVLVAIALLGVHYKLAYGKMDNKALCLAGFVGYFVILFVSKGFDLGFPKDTGAEQIVALKDESYSALHLGLHGALIANLALTACSVPSPFASAKTA